MTVFWFVFVVALIGIGLAVDLFCKLTGRPTLSRVVHEAASKWPFVAFVLGVIVGLLAWHFFIPGECY